MLARALETIALLAVGTALVWHGDGIDQTYLLGVILLIGGIAHADWPTSDQRHADRIAGRL